MPPTTICPAPAGIAMQVAMDRGHTHSSALNAPQPVESSVLCDVVGIREPNHRRRWEGLKRGSKEYEELKAERQEPLWNAIEKVRCERRRRPRASG